MTDERSQFEAWNKCYSTIIHALSDIVCMGTLPKDDDAIRRDPVMAKVMTIRAAIDAYGQAARAAPAQPAMKSLPPDIAKALADNIATLYEGAAPAQPAGERVLMYQPIDGSQFWKESTYKSPKEATDGERLIFQYAWATIERITDDRPCADAHTPQSA